VETNRVFIVGGGPSVSKFNLAQLTNEKTICINQAVFDTPNPDYLISCDYTFVNKVKRQRIQSLNCTRIFVAQFINHVVQDVAARIVDTKLNIIYDLSCFDVIIKARNRSGIGSNFRDFRTGGNSGYCGLQLAILLGFKQIVLVGFDLTMEKNRTHYHNVYTTDPQKFTNRLDSYYHEFSTGLISLKSSHPEISVTTAYPGRLNNIIPVSNYG
jgi:hypothetical protein